MVEEFIDTYSDDLIYLIEARKALLTHPFRTEIKELCDASFCRLLIVFVVGSLEAMLKHWIEKFGIRELEIYFAERVKNSERIQALYNAFQKKGVNVDIEVLNDYLAIKYLRNAICHARWYDHEKEWCEKRGFPTDTRKLSEEHWYKILEVNENMMMYIALTGIPELTRRIPQDKVIRVRKEKEELKPMIIRRKDLPYVVFKNLGNIASEIYKVIEKVATSEKYNWSKGLSPNELEKLSDHDAKIMFYTAVKRARDEGLDEIIKQRELMKDAIYFWKLYKEETFVRNNITLADIEKSFKLLNFLHQRKFYISPLPFPWDENLPQQVKTQLIKAVGNPPEGISDIETIKSLDVGKLTCDFMPDITPVSLFVVYLPLIDPESAKAQMEEIKFILAAWRLRVVWYDYIERCEQPDTSLWIFYERLLNKLL